MVKLVDIVMRLMNVKNVTRVQKKTYYNMHLMNSKPKQHPDVVMRFTGPHNAGLNSLPCGFLQGFQHRGTLAFLSHEVMATLSNADAISSKHAFDHKGGMCESNGN